MNFFEEEEEEEVIKKESSGYNPLNDLFSLYKKGENYTPFLNPNNQTMNSYNEIKNTNAWFKIPPKKEKWEKKQK